MTEQGDDDRMGGTCQCRKTMIEQVDDDRTGRTCQSKGTVTDQGENVSKQGDNDRTGWR